MPGISTRKSGASSSAYDCPLITRPANDPIPLEVPVPSLPMDALAEILIPSALISPLKREMCPKDPIELAVVDSGVISTSPLPCQPPRSPKGGNDSATTPALSCGFWSSARKENQGPVCALPPSCP